MNKMQEQVKDFHEAFGLLIGKEPGLRGAETNTLRKSLIEEEAREFSVAVAEGDFLEAIDALADILYVVFGAAVSFGIDLEAHFEEVHKCNMAKIGGHKRADGKWIKPEGWIGPDHARVMKEVESKRDH